MQKVAIIFINYRDYAEKYLDDCIASLRQQTWRGETKLYIVDNASTDDSLAYLKKHAPEAIILPRKNGNYSAANALGIYEAMEAGCNYYIIANMDVVFEKKWLAELVAAAEREPAAGMVQSKVMLWPEKTKVNSLGNIIHFLGFGFTKGYKEQETIEVNEIKETIEINGYASGSSMLIKREVIECIGNYDGEYYMYHDDMEMSWRARLAGYKIVLAPRSVVYHKYEFQRSIKMLYYMERNRYFVVFSFYKLPTILFILPPLIIMDIGMLGYSLVSGWFWTKLNVYGYFLRPRSWLHIGNVRRSVKKYRKISDRAIVQTISGRVEYQEIMNPILKYIVNPVFDAYWRLARLFIFW